MSKIGKKPISLQNIQVDVKGQDIHYKGKYGSGVYSLPNFIMPEINDSELFLKLKNGKDKNKFWGLHRALLANKLKGINQLFEKKMQIVGLGFKAELTGTKIKFSLGFSHKIEKHLPKGISFEVDKTGQILTLKSADKEQLGQFCADIKSLRPPEPYKGTGIKMEGERIRRKAGKTKAAA